MTERNHKDFLQEKDFIAWRLTGDPLLEASWRAYLEEHPEQKETFEQAIRQFSHLKLNTERLTLTEERSLLSRIYASEAKAYKKKMRLRYIQYAAAACILMAAGLFFFQDSDETPNIPPFLSEHLTRGENLNEEEIYLTTDSNTISFDKDVRVQIKKEGSALIEEVGSGKSSVIEANKTGLNKLVVPYGKRSQLILSDGSKVWLNSGSVLEFPFSFSGNSRVVNLTGEMYIEVAKDSKKPFYVNTLDFQVKVYGTQFNISAYQDDSCQSVVLITGSVRIQSRNKQETFLKPNEMLVYTDQEMKKQPVDVNSYISWKEGYMLMEQTPMAIVLKQIERYYNVSFEIGENVNLKSRTCTGKLYLSDNLENVLQTVCLLSSLRYTRHGKTIHIDINP